MAIRTNMECIDQAVEDCELKNFVLKDARINFGVVFIADKDTRYGLAYKFSINSQYTLK